MRRTGRTTRAAAIVAAAFVTALALSSAAGPAAAAEALSLTLDDAIALALEHNDQLAIARAQAAAADARLGQARGAFLPRLSASGSYTKLDEAPYMDASQFGDFFSPLMEPFMYLVEHGYLDPSTLEGLSTGGAERIYLGDDDIYSVGVSVRQPLFTGGALLSAHGAAKHAAAAGRLNADRTEDQVRYDATQAYTALVAARAALDVSERMLEQMKSHLSDVEALHGAGMLLDSDLMRAGVRMSEMALQHNRAEHMVELAQAGLAFVIGADVESTIEPADGLEGGSLVQGDLASLTARALSNRPDLAAAGELVGAADNAVSLARSGYFPQLVLIGNYSWDRPNREYEPEFYEHWRATLALELNVFDWGVTSGKVREAEAGRTQAERARDMFEAAVRLEVKQSYLQRDEALTALRIAEDGLSQAREAMRVTRESFRNGAATNSDVLDAQAALAGAEMNRVRAVVDLRLAEARLALAVGGVN